MIIKYFTTEIEGNLNVIDNYDTIDTNQGDI